MIGILRYHELNRGLYDFRVKSVLSSAKRQAVELMNCLVHVFSL